VQHKLSNEVDTLGQGKAGTMLRYDRVIVAAAPFGAVRPVKRSMTNIDELKSTGLKATLPRLKILEIFQKGASGT
jgi:hypothetical protein